MSKKTKKPQTPLARYLATIDELLVRTANAQLVAGAANRMGYEHLLERIEHNLRDAIYKIALDRTPSATTDPGVGTFASTELWLDFVEDQLEGLERLERLDDEDSDEDEDDEED